MPPFRSRTLAGFALLMLSAGVLLWWVLAQRTQPATTFAGVNLPVPVAGKTRSLLLITTDTTRPDRLEPYGASDVATPNLRRIAETGIVMERAFAVAPLTLPAHTTIHTGLYPPQHGVRNNGIHYASEDLTTLAEIASSAGRRTAAFVSAAVLEKRYGLPQGFELYDDDLSTGLTRSPRMVPDRPAGSTVDSAMAWFDTIGDDEEFFVWVHFYDPHASYNPPAPFRDDYRERLYDGEIAYMDQQIGRLLQHPRLRDDRDLVLAVVGDHGESFGEHGEQTHGVLAYSATLHIPWLLRVGDLGAKGLRVANPVSQVDVLPTLAFAAGLKAPDGLPGRNLFAAGASAGPVFGADSSYSEAYLPFYTYGWSKVKVARKWPWELIDSSRPELYDLSRDPRELSDLYQERPEIVHDMEQMLTKLNSEFGDGGEHEQDLAVDEEAMDRLRALGYVSASSTTRTSDQARPSPVDVIHVHVGLERGRQLLRDRLWDLAAERFRAVLRDDPNNLAAMTELATALRGARRIDEAALIAERALTLDPSNQQVILLMAGLERARGRDEHALELIETAVAVDPRNSAVWVQRAGFFLSQRQPKEVEDSLRRGLESDPEDGPLNALFAYHVEAQSDPEAALVRLRGTVERDPFLATGWRLLGGLEESRGELPEAEASYRKGLAKVPDDEDLRARLAILLARQGSDQAEAHLREAIRLASDELPIELHLALGARLAETGQPEAAIKQYEKILDVHPTHPGARNNRAVAYARTGRVDQALVELESVVATAPNYADAHNNLAAIAVFVGRWPLARTEANRALALDPGLVEAWDNLGRAERALGDHSAAVLAFSQALERNADYLPSRAARGQELLVLGQLERARTDFNDVLSREPNSIDAHVGLADLLLREAGGKAEARKHLQAILRLAPRHDRAAWARQKLEELGTGG